MDEWKSLGLEKEVVVFCICIRNFGGLLDLRGIEIGRIGICVSVCDLERLFGDMPLVCGVRRVRCAHRSRKV